jgi:protein gp37
MGGKTKIEWTDATWNPIRGCSRVSEGCRNCYAEAMAARFSDPGQWGHGIATRANGGRWTGNVVLDEKALVKPLYWRKPRRIFVNSVSDLFHESVTDEMRDRIFAVMALCPQHTFQILTKRPERMHQYLTASRTLFGIAHADPLMDPLFFDTHDWPLPNVWLGASVENQAAADERAPIIRDIAEDGWQTFFSCEPLLSQVHVLPYLAKPAEALRGAVWLICGGESGPHARPMHPQWARDLRDQCSAAEVPFFMKQMGGTRKPFSPIPDDLMIREAPHA